MSVTTLNVVPRFLKMFSHLGTSYHSFSQLITLYPPALDTKVMSTTTLNLVPRLLKMLTHRATSYHALPHLPTLYPLSFIER